MSTWVVRARHHYAKSKVTVAVRALLVARPGPLAYGLWAVLSTISRIEAVDQVDDLASALGTRLEADPAVVLLDLDRLGDEDLTLLKQIKTRWPGARCLVLVNAVQHQPATESAGADAVLVKGCLAVDLISAVESLLVLPPS